MEALPHSFRLSRHELLVQPQSGKKTLVRAAFHSESVHGPDSSRWYSPAPGAGRHPPPADGLSDLVFHDVETPGHVGKRRGQPFRGFFFLA